MMLIGTTKSERERGDGGCSERRYIIIITGKSEYFSVPKVPRQCPLVLLVRVGTFTLFQYSEHVNPVPVFRVRVPCLSIQGVSIQGTCTLSQYSGHVYPKMKTTSLSEPVVHFCLTASRDVAAGCGCVFPATRTSRLFLLVLFRGRNFLSERKILRNRLACLPSIQPTV
jgi:hypothetical protein